MADIRLLRRVVGESSRKYWVAERFPFKAEVACLVLTPENSVYQGSLCLMHVPGVTTAGAHIAIVRGRGAQEVAHLLTGKAEDLIKDMMGYLGEEE